MATSTYILEWYVPGYLRDDVLAALRRLEDAAAATSAAAHPVRYVGSTLVADEETCFCELEGSSEDVVRRTVELAGLDHARIVPAERVPADGEKRGRAER